MFTKGEREGGKTEVSFCLICFTYCLFNPFSLSCPLTVQALSTPLHNQTSRMNCLYSMFLLIQLPLQQSVFCLYHSAQTGFAKFISKCFVSNLINVPQLSFYLALNVPSLPEALFSLSSWSSALLDFYLLFWQLSLRLFFFSLFLDVFAFHYIALGILSSIPCPLTGQLIYPCGFLYQPYGGDSQVRRLL